MKKILTILTICVAIIGGTIWYARAIDLKQSQVTQTVKERKDGQVTIVTQEAAPVSAGKDADSIKARCDEALERVGKAEEWLNRIEEDKAKQDERITKIEEKAGIATEKEKLP
jgi:uncharacterized protein YxeA